MCTVEEQHHTIKPKIQHQFRSRFRKPSPSLFRAGWLGEIARVRPSTDGEKNLELSVLFLE